MRKWDEENISCFKIGNSIKEILMERHSGSRIQDESSEFVTVVKELIINSGHRDMWLAH